MLNRIRKEIEDFRALDKSWKAFFISVMGAILVAAFLILGVLMPYTPYTAYNYSVVPEVVCPGDEIDVKIEREVTGGLYSVDSIESTSYWLDRGEPLPMVEDGTSVAGASYPLEVSERQVVESRLIRNAPLDTGETYAGSVNVVRGRMFWIIPTSQTVNLRAENPIMVKDPLSPECIPDRLEGE